jgi:hypothetical protein
MNHTDMLKQLDSLLNVNPEKYFPVAEFGLNKSYRMEQMIKRKCEGNRGLIGNLMRDQEIANLVNTYELLEMFDKKP